MSRLLAFLLFAGLGAGAFAEDIDVGESTISIPFPDGFVELTPEMGPYYDTMAAYTMPTNVRFFTLVPTETAETLLSGEYVDLPRFFNIESERAMMDRSVSTSDFAELRAYLSSQLEQLFVTVEETVGEVVDQSNAALSESYGAEVKADVGETVPLSVHTNTENKLAFTSKTTVGGTFDGAASEPDTIITTSLILHVQDKVLFLYVYGTGDDIEWTRRQAAAWGDAILAANPLSSEAQAAREEADAFGIDWNSVLRNAAIGAVAGGLIAFIASIFRRRRKTDDGSE
jgi:hypothetical protein